MLIVFPIDEGQGKQAACRAAIDAAIDEPTQSLGQHPMKGITGPREVFALRSQY